MKDQDCVDSAKATHIEGGKRKKKGEKQIVDDNNKGTDKNHACSNAFHFRYSKLFTDQANLIKWLLLI